MQIEAKVVRDQVGVRGALQDVPQGSWPQRIILSARSSSMQDTRSLRSSGSGIDEMGLVDEQECELFILLRRARI